MIGVKYTIVPDGDIAMDEIAAFETESYYGLYSSNIDTFIVMAKEDVDFDVTIMPDHIDKDNLGEVNQWMRDAFGELITGVAKRNGYKLVLKN